MPRTPRHTVVVAMTASASGALTVYLVAALAVQIRSALHLGADAFGLVIASYYAGAALGSIPSGRLAESRGGSRVMRWSALLATAILLILAAAGRSWPVLAGLLLIAGAVAAAMQNSTNLVLARRVDPAHQGLAFGLKQAAVPIATVFAGITVPTLALTVGWRWAFVLASLFTLGTAIAVPRVASAARADRRPAPRQALHPLLPLVVLAVGFALGVFAASGLTAFLVTGGVATGMSKAAAGVLFAVAGLVAGSSRVLTGFLADRRGRAHLVVVAVMLVAGAAGYAVLAEASAITSPVLYMAGACLVYGTGWSWNGLFNFAVVRLYPESPARATSVTQTGARLAGVAGPLVFGVLVATTSYAVAWSIAGTACVASAAVMLLGRVLRRRSKREGHTWIRSSLPQ